MPNQADKPCGELPHTWQTEIPNGITVLGAQSTETPTTSLLLKIPPGLYYETPAQDGDHQLTGGYAQ